MVIYLHELEGPKNGKRNYPYSKMSSFNPARKTNIDIRCFLSTYEEDEGSMIIYFHVLEGPKMGSSTTQTAKRAV